MEENIINLGPLAPLAGRWTGTKGHDTAPGDDRGTETNLFREEFVFEPIGRVDNHEQMLYGLRYLRVAWRIGEPAPFHEQVGYFLWDVKTESAMHSFFVPRGIGVLAGSKAPPKARSFKFQAELGSPTFGILSNPFLDREFKTVRYEGKLEIVSHDSFSYEEDTVIQIKNQPSLFHHIDKNTLTRVK